ncbi:MAG: Gfo/Idh/MocA family oxidoreductase [Phycisphaerae bacterium]
MGQRASMIFNHPRRVMDLEPVKKPIRIGVIGLGPRANNVLSSVTKYEEYKLIAVCDILPQIVKKVTGNLKKDLRLTVRGYTDWQKMIKTEDLDAVAVQVDPDRQISICCAAMQAGLHVMAEVPLSYNLDDCWNLVTTVERTQKIFLLMEQLRYAGYARAWRDIVKSGIVGKPLFAEGEYFHYLPCMFFRDSRGTNFDPDQVRHTKKKDVKPTWRYLQPPIGYLPHELSPLLYILDDRVTKVSGMGNRKLSYKYDNIKYPDTQIAVMHTEKDVVMRMGVGFSTTNMPRGQPLLCHWQHVKGSEGVLEMPRGPEDKFKLWVEAWHLKEPLRVPWTLDRNDAPPEAGQSGHGGLDYYVFAHFADAVLYGQPLEFDVYKAVETAAPAIMAAQSIDQGEVSLDVPDFRPGPHRKPGQLPSRAKK